MGTRLILAAVLAWVVACIAPAIASATTIQAAPIVNVAPHQITIVWATDISSSTEVYWGPNSEALYTSYPNSSIYAPLAGLAHSRTLTGIAPGTYYFRARSDDGGSPDVSAEGSFTVAANTAQGVLDTVSVNGDVSAVAASDGAIYLGGSFTEVDVRRGHGVTVDASSGTLTQQDQPHVSGGNVINASVADGQGGFFIGGNFKSVGGLARNNVAHILPDGGVDPNWNADVNGVVSAITLAGSSVYIGGAFTSVNGGTSRSYVASVNNVTGAADAWNPVVNQFVNSIAVSGGIVYLGGAFTSVQATTRNHAAAVSATSGATLQSWNPDVDGDVRSIVISGSEVYLGGMFTNVNTTSAAAARNHVAAVDITTGTATAFNPNVNGNVETMSIAGSVIYFGGWFTSVGGTTRNHAAAVDVTGAAGTGSLMAWDPDVSSVVYTMVQSGPTMYLGGWFTTAKGSTPRRHAAAFDMSASGAVTGWDPHLGGITVRTLAAAGSKVYIGGDFTTANAGTVRNRAAAIDPNTGALLSWNPDLGGSVADIEVLGSTVYLAGSFTTANGATIRNRAAAVDGSTGALTTWNPNLNGNALAIEIAQGTAFIGGLFTTAKGSTTRNHAAAFDLSGTGALQSWDPDANGNVEAIATLGSNVYLAGAFTAVQGGTTRNRAAAIDMVGSGALQAWDPDLGAAAHGLAVQGSQVYIVGDFVTVKGGTTRNRAAAFDATSGTLDGSWDPDIRFVGARAVTPVGGSVYLGGDFSFVNHPTARTRIAEVNAGAGTVTSWDPSLNDSVFSLAVGCGNGKLYAGGKFTDAGVASQQGIATFPVNAMCPAPLVPPLVTPSPGAIVVSTTPQLTAKYATPNTGYGGHLEFQICSDAGCTAVEQSGSSAGGLFDGQSGSWTAGSALAAGSVHYWRARSWGVGSQFSSYSATQSFTVNSAPVAPSLASPANSALLFTTTPTLSATFNDSDSGDTGRIDFELCSDVGCTAVLQTGSSSAGTAIGTSGSWTPLSSLTAGTTYYWRALGVDASGASSGMTTTRSFTVDSIPTAPTSTAPADAAYVASTTPTLSATFHDADSGDTGTLGFELCSNADCSTVAQSGSSSAGVAIGATGSWTVGSALTNGTTYYWRARGTDAVAATGPFGSIRSLVVDTTPPPSVTSLASSASTNIAPSLTWTPVTDAGAGVAYYRVYRSTSLGVLGSQINVDGATTAGSYSDVDSLTSGTTYRYTVQAVDGAGNEQPTGNNQISVLFDSVAPPAVSDAAASSPTAGSRVLSWSGVTDSGSGLAFYRVYRSTSGGSLGSQINSDGATTGATYTDATTPVSGVYYYTVRAVDVVGNEQATGNNQVAVAYDTDAPSAVSDAAASSPTAGSRVLSWSASSDAGVGVAYYRVYRSASNGVLGTQINSDGATTGASYTDASTPASGTYYYTVQAVDSVANEQATGNNQVAVVYDVTAPPAVSDAAASSPTAGSRVLSWSGVTDSLSGLAYYRVYRSTSGGSLGSQINSDGATTGASYTDASTPASGTYYYTVQAVDVATNEQATGNNQVAVVYDVTAPPAVSDAAASSPTAGSRVVSWSGVTDSGSGLAFYRVYRSTSGGSLGSQINSDGATTGATYTDATTPASGTYHYTVRAVDVVGNEQTTGNNQVAVVFDVTAPPAVSDAAASSPTAGSRVVSWSGVTDSGSGLAYYRVYRSTSGGSLGSQINSDGATTGASYTDASTPASGTYYYTVQAVDSVANEQATGNNQVAVVYDVTAPPAVSDATASSPTAGSRVLSWSGVTDSLSGLAYYRVYRSTSGGSLGSQINSDGATTGASYTDVSTPASGTYYYTVQAVDVATNEQSAGNNQVAVVYDVTAPPAVSDAAASSPTAGSRVVSWSGVTDSGSGLAFYRVYRSTSGGSLGSQINSDGATTGATYTDATTPASGTYHYTVRAVDVVGNEQTTGNNQVAVVYDRTNPSGTIVNGTSAGASRSIQLSGTSTDTQSGVQQVDVDFNGPGSSDGAVCSVTSTPTTWSCTWNTAALPIGSYVVTSTITDLMGNTASASVTVNVDLTPGVPVLQAPASGSTTDNTSPTLEAQLVDADSGDSGTIEYQVCADASCTDEVATGSSADVSAGASATWDVDPSLGTDLTFYWRARGHDSLGLIGAWSSTSTFTTSLRIDGTTGSDDLTGSTNDEEMFGGAGNDHVDGGAGSDVIDGGAGSDVLAGGAGNDNVTGGTGNDKVSGGAGSDTLQGGSGNDKVDGGPGRDQMTGGPGKDTLTGGAGGDLIVGSAGRDKISSGSGNDRINALENHEAMTFRMGGFSIELPSLADLESRAGTRGDTVTCGPGRDQVIAEKNDKVDHTCERVTRKKNFRH